MQGTTQAVRARGRARAERSLRAVRDGEPARRDRPRRAAASTVTPRAGVRQEYARPTATPFPADNAWSAEREALGRALFFDPRLSASGIIACATCHNPGFSWGDGLARGVGHQSKLLRRRSPTLLNLAWAEALFWDGRAFTLEEQALGPIKSPDEMNMPLEQLIPKIQAVAGYAALFERAYPGEGVTTDTLAKAIATFERTVVSGTAPFDRYIAGRRERDLAEAARGFDALQRQGQVRELPLRLALHGRQLSRHRRTG